MIYWIIYFKKLDLHIAYINTYICYTVNTIKPINKNGKAINIKPNLTKPTS